MNKLNSAAEVKSSIRVGAWPKTDWIAVAMVSYAEKKAKMIWEGNATWREFLDFAKKLLSTSPEIESVHAYDYETRAWLTAAAR